MEAYAAFVKNLSVSLYIECVTKKEKTMPIGIAPNVSINVKTSLQRNLLTSMDIVIVIAIAIEIISYPTAYNQNVPLSSYPI